ncbi:zinc ribbon domain-containing protein [Sutcliffiella horikoshii]|uniref:zinc ribbon domain-containing protein n=1 Tax=Sutcliffiella horikoshii TaxID=79883 RepID=UPI003CF2754F
MKCNNCGVEGKLGNKFCKECGTSFIAPTEQTEMSTVQTEMSTVQTEVAATIETTSQQPNVMPNSSSIAKDQRNAQTDEYVAKGKELAMNYWDFAKTALKRPSHTATNILGIKSNFILSLVTLVLFSLLLALIVMTNVSTVSRGYVEPEMMQPFLYLLIFMVITVIVLYGVGKYTKSDFTLQDVTSKFGALMVIPLGILVVSFVLSLVKIVSFSTSLLFVAILSVIVAIIQVVQLLVASGAKKVDPFYVSIVTLLVLAGVIYLFGENLINSINPLSNIF